MHYEREKTHFNRSFCVDPVAVTVIALTACADDEEITENWKVYTADAVVTDTGFSAQLVLAEGEFASSNKADFVLSATSVNDGTGGDYIIENI